MTRHVSAALWRVLAEPVLLGPLGPPVRGQPAPSEAAVLTSLHVASRLLDLFQEEGHVDLLGALAACLLLPGPRAAAGCAPHLAAPAVVAACKRAAPREAWLARLRPDAPPRLRAAALRCWVALVCSPAPAPPRLPPRTHTRTAMLPWTRPAPARARRCTAALRARPSHGPRTPHPP